VSSKREPTRPVRPRRRIANLAKTTPVSAPLRFRSVDVSTARDGLAETLNRVAYGKERVIIRRRGKALAAVVPLEDLRFLEAAEDRLDAADGHRALAAAKTKNEQSIPWEQVKAELGL
jgi:prevent-host-death family protein